MLLQIILVVLVILMHLQDGVELLLEVYEHVFMIDLKILDLDRIQKMMQMASL
jgi:hypothetical protein